MYRILKSSFIALRTKYWPLIKSLQTGLLLSTGLAGYLSAKGSPINETSLIRLALSLFLAISGSTVLNMWYDRDIDARMKRTCNRPLAKGRIRPEEALWLGVILTAAGLGWSLTISLLYGVVIFAGFFFDVVIYTYWLKRRTAWSIIWGGISGGMPVLAGRVLAVGRVDGIGILLALAVLFWIPTHILTYNLRYWQDYQTACIPTFPLRYGFTATRRMIAFSSVAAATCMGAASIWIGVTAGVLRLLAVLSSGLMILALTSWIKPSEQVNFGLFKYASLYMLAAMLLLVVGT